MPQSNYRIESDNPGQPLVIRDVGPWQKYMTVTNNAEAVVAELFALGYLADGRRLLYFDSEGALDELRHDMGAFTGFAPGPERRG